VIWKYEYLAKNGSPTYPGPRATPTVDGDLVYTLSYDGQLKALKAATGELVWEADFVKDFGGKISQTNRHGWCGSPLVVDNLLIVHPGAPGASVVAFDKKTGKVVWQSGDDTASFASPVFFEHGKQRMVLMLSGSGLYAYDLADGKPLWDIPWRGAASLNSPDPVIVGDKIFVTAGNTDKGDNKGDGSFLVEIKDGIGQTVYERIDADTIISQCWAPVLVDGYLYGPSGYISHTKMVCVDPATGDRKWTDSRATGSLIAAGKHLVIQTFRGHIVIAEASPEGFKEIARTEEPVITGQCWTQPTVANGRIFCRNTEGDLVCLGLTP